MVRRYYAGVDVSMKRAVLIVALLTSASLSFCADRPTIPADRTVTGKVVGVTDGDTVTLLVGTVEYRIRLAEIDAPETKQPHGNRANNAFSDLVFGKTVQMESWGTDKYGRTLGTILLDGKSINLAMVARGWASHYKRSEVQDSRRCGDSGREGKVGALG